MKSRIAIAMAGALLYLVGSNAQASYMYDWSTISGGTVSLFSDSGQYKMTINNEPNRGPLDHGTDTTAAKLSIFQVPSVPHGTDTFHGAFDLKLVVQDLANSMTNNGMGGNPPPLIYHVTFTTTVNSDGSTSTSAVSLSPSSDSITLGLDTFIAKLPSTGQYFVAPPTVGSVNTGTVGLTIDFVPGREQSPEPSSLILGGLGMSFAGLSAWRRKKQSKAVAV